ncbi:hypothetical protein NEAUS03_0350 [Nematocida ausubeli]|nr:hypothetical protein NEAUS03_0350 [Nematocida ausubeli]
METIGRFFTLNWTIPIFSCHIRIIFTAKGKQEKWTAEYKKNNKQWAINNELITSSDTIEFGFENNQYFLGVAAPSCVYAFEINELQKILSAGTGTRFKQIYRSIKRQLGMSTGIAAHYKNLLKTTSCFVQQKGVDIYGRRITLWKTDTQQIENFRAIRAGVQNILVKFVNRKEHVKVFYTSKKSSVQLGREKKEKQKKKQKEEQSEQKSKKKRQKRRKIEKSRAKKELF